MPSYRAIPTPRAHVGVRGLLCALLSVLLIGGIGAQAVPVAASAVTTVRGDEHGALDPVGDATPASRHAGVGWRQHALAGGSGVTPTGGHGVTAVLPASPRAIRPTAAHTVTHAAGRGHPRGGLLTAPGRAPPSTGS